MPQASAGKTLGAFGAAAKRSRPRKRFFTSERGLGLAGLTLAAASGSFAAYMITDTSRQPYFSGAEYLTVFAKLTPGARSGPGWPAPRPEGAAADTDELATAAVPSNPVAGAHDGLDPSPAYRTNPGALAFGSSTLGDYVLRSVTRGVAVIESPDGLREVRPGSVIPFAGLVTSIEQQEGRWIVVTSRGIIRESRR